MAQVWMAFGTGRKIDGRHLPSSQRPSWKWSISILYCPIMTLFFWLGRVSFVFWDLFLFFWVWFEFPSFFFPKKKGRFTRNLYKFKLTSFFIPLFITLAFPEVARSLREKPLFSRLHWDLVPQSSLGSGSFGQFFGPWKTFGDLEWQEKQEMNGRNWIYLTCQNRNGSTIYIYI